MSRKNIIFIVVGVLVVVAVGFWFWSKNRQAPSAFPLQKPIVPTLGSTIFEKTQSPLKGQVPDTNPFKDQKNPLDVIYQNPFK